MKTLIQQLEAAKKTAMDTLDKSSPQAGVALSAIDAALYCVRAEQTRLDLEKKTPAKAEAAAT